MNYEDLSLDELFKVADEIGRKYQTPAELKAFDDEIEQLAQSVDTPDEASTLQLATIVLSKNKAE